MVDASGAQSAAVAAFDPSLVEDMLANRDALIAELQQAVVELSDAHNDAGVNSRSECAGLCTRLDTLEHRMLEQEQTIRHTLTMLIEWIETDGGRSIAA